MAQYTTLGLKTQAFFKIFLRFLGMALFRYSNSLAYVILNDLLEDL
jgi:hypothetical protein